MSHKPSRHTILSIAPSTRGFGFALVEDKALIDWGCKTVKGEKNAATLAKVRKLIDLYTPTMLVIQDYSARPTRRAERIRQLGVAMGWLATDYKLTLKLVAQVKVQRVFFGKRRATKQEIAQALASRFPQELVPLLPPKRKPWMPQHPRMDMFDAIALAVAQAHARKG